MSKTPCKMLSVPSIKDERGILVFVEGGKHIPFPIKRIFYIYGMQKKRGGHAHKKCEQVIIPINGKFDVITDDGKARKRYRLDDPGAALYVPPKIWVEVENFSRGAVILVLSSDLYKENDYIRDYIRFMAKEK
ncbi:MAG: FdtA/QdtA family cupin domain-containing protein [Candidatus Aenigmarchaeota archaeon]|nr:FdtA/QdtA family cupin domain-containing protein [Candidatus Aenigmarchaeota archaeon]